MSEEKQVTKGLTGLENVGNTCFINSIIQILSHTYELSDLIVSKRELLKGGVCDSELIRQWDDLRKLMWNENCTITPHRFINCIQQVAKNKDRELFSGFEQNDSTEFLVFFMDCFHTALSREVIMSIDGQIQNETDKIAVKCFETIKSIYENDYSEIFKMCYGVQISRLTRTNGEELISMVPEPYFVLSLPIPQGKKNPTLIDCFELYTCDEVIDGENAFTDETTGEKISVTKKMTFWNFPDILVIDLKRYNSQNMKNQINVHFPLEDLNLSKYVIGYNNNLYKYELYAVSNHIGNVMGGHYTSFVKNNNGHWYHFDDAKIQQVQDNNRIVTPKAYCLFYRRTK